jgi:hypothetical protein
MLEKHMSLQAAGHNRSDFAKILNETLQGKLVVDLQQWYILEFRSSWCLWQNQCGWLVEGPFSINDHKTLLPACTKGYRKHWVKLTDPPLVFVKAFAGFRDIFLILLSPLHGFIAYQINPRKDVIDMLVLDDS